MSLYQKEPNRNDNQTHQEHKNGNAINAVHISHPSAMRRIRISLFQVEIFSELPPDSHNAKFESNVPLSPAIIYLPVRKLLQIRATYLILY
jgi:hypothetical protein